jgi:hypothetical protein
LDSAQVYRLAGRALVLSPNVKIEVVSQLLECIRASNTGDTTLCDDVIGACIRSAYDPSLIDPLIKLLSNDVNKFDAFIRNDKLKSAYFLAHKKNSVTDVTRVLEASKRLNNAAMTTICNRWLKAQAKTRGQHSPTDD